MPITVDTICAVIRLFPCPNRTSSWSKLIVSNHHTRKVAILIHVLIHVLRRDPTTRTRRTVVQDVVAILVTTRVSIWVQIRARVHGTEDVLDASGIWVARVAWWQDGELEGLDVFFLVDGFRIVEGEVHVERINGGLVLHGRVEGDGGVGYLDAGGCGSGLEQCEVSVIGQYAAVLVRRDCLTLSSPKSRHP
jgi:hypothetical protein